MADVAGPRWDRLPRLTPARLAFRRIFQWLDGVVVRLFVDLHVEGRANAPQCGPLIVVSNHLADADVVVELAIAPWTPEIFGKAALREIAIVGQLMDAYGTIWVEPFSADRVALRAGLEALQQGRILALAPEGRESHSGALERGTSGAAFLALRSGAPVLPVGIAGTEHVLPELRRLRRASVQAKVGEPFYLQATGDRRADLDAGTRLIMVNLAALLPPEYRGAYA